MNNHAYLLVQEECTAYTNWEVVKTYYYGTKYGAGLYEPVKPITNQTLIDAIERVISRRKK